MMNAKNKQTLKFLTPWKKATKEIEDSKIAQEKNLNAKNLSFKAKCMKVIMCLFSFKAIYILIMSDNLRHFKAHSIGDDALIALTVLVIILNLIPQSWLIKLFKVKERQEKKSKQMQTEETDKLFNNANQETLTQKPLNKTLSSSL